MTGAPRLAAQVERAVPVPKENKTGNVGENKAASDCAERGANIPLDFRTFLQWMSRQGAAELP